MLIYIRVRLLFLEGGDKMEEQFYEFNDENEINKWFNSNYKKFIKKIQKDFNVDNTLGNAVFCYTGSMSKSYNIILNFNDGAIENIDSMIDQYFNSLNLGNKSYNNEFDITKILARDTKIDIRLLFNAFSLNSITNNIILFHYFDIHYFDEEILNKDIFQINNFISTTLLKKSLSIERLIYTNNYNALLIIKTKKGLPCIPIGNNPNSYLKEYEMILKPRTKFKINKVNKKLFSKIKYIIECEIID